MRYFLAPRSGERAYENHLSTIKHGVPFERINPHLTEEGRKILSGREVIYAWGNRSAKRASWERMQKGDLILFYANKQFVMSGKVIYKQHSPDLALAMWPPDDKGHPWEYTFFLGELKSFEIPLNTFNKVSGYNFQALQGFQEIAQPYLERILSKYPNFEDFLDEFADTGEEQPTETERVDVSKKFAGVEDYGDLSIRLKELEEELRDKPVGKRRRSFMAVERDERVVQLVKKQANYQCEICGVPGFEKRDGSKYAEAHHVEQLAISRIDAPSNVICVCPTCHKVIEHGSDKALEERKKLKPESSVLSE